LFTLDPSSLWILNGRPVPTKVSPATVTAGGSVAVSSVSPGEGWFPAGTVVSVRGVGFTGQTRVSLEDANITAERVVSPTEIRFTLAEAATMTAARVRVDNPDGSRSIYYSYLHGLPAATSSRALLSATQPIFSGTARPVATVGPIPATNSMQYFALALQNPGLAVPMSPLRSTRPTGRFFSRRHDARLRAPAAALNYPSSSTAWRHQHSCVALVPSKRSGAL
jgi:hypothetical protein